jgi:hypothetical protein
MPWQSIRHSFSSSNVLAFHTFTKPADSLLDQSYRERERERDGEREMERVMEREKWRERKKDEMEKKMMRKWGKKALNHTD